MVSLNFYELETEAGNWKLPESFRDGNWKLEYLRMSNRIDAQTPLEKLLQVCAAREHPLHQQGWREFARRYHQNIYGYVRRSCAGWRHERVYRQFNDIVNDVVSDIYLLLYEKLGTFRITEVEKFDFWLRTVCQRAAHHSLKRKSISLIVESDIDFLRSFRAESDRWVAMELYETVVEKLRDSAKHQKSHIERDIHIFYLYIWADLPEVTIHRHPCLQSLGERVIQVTASRMRNKLR